MDQRARARIRANAELLERRRGAPEHREQFLHVGLSPRGACDIRHDLLDNPAPDMPKTRITSVTPAAARSGSHPVASANSHRDAKARPFRSPPARHPHLRDLGRAARTESIDKFPELVATSSIAVFQVIQSLRYRSAARLRVCRMVASVAVPMSIRSLMITVKLTAAIMAGSSFHDRTEVEPLPRHIGQRVLNLLQFGARFIFSGDGEGNVLRGHGQLLRAAEARGGCEDDRRQFVRPVTVTVIVTDWAHLGAPLCTSVHGRQSERRDLPLVRRP